LQDHNEKLSGDFHPYKNLSNDEHADIITNKAISVRSPQRHIW